MYYYKRNIGDYHKKAGRLSILQHGIYMLLIDACYDREQFPTHDDAIEWTWAVSADEIAAVELVLRKFFVLDGDVYTQKRIQEELDSYKEKCVTNKRIANDRETKRAKSKRNVDKSARNVNEAPPNHKPRTINQEPITIITDDDFSAKLLNAMGLKARYDQLRMMGQHQTVGVWDSYLKDWQGISGILDQLADIRSRNRSITSINYFVTAISSNQEPAPFDVKAAVKQREKEEASG